MTPLNALTFFLPITKVDVAKREVYGRATQEVVDKSGEIFDYATSKPLFEQWSAEFAKATDGKSLGNVRAMHAAVAAGKLTAIDFNDADRAIDVCAKIVDDAEWAKVAEGVYTGFSIGGSYERRWADEADPTKKRFTARPSEISIVDNPCVPTATFQMVKADGVVEEHPFKGREVEVPDPLAGGAPAADKAAGAAGATGIRKGMYGVSELAEMLERIRYMTQDAQWEAEWEQDGSALPAQLRAWLAAGATILGAMVAEEAQELVESVTPPADTAAAAGETTVAITVTTTETTEAAAADTTVTLAAAAPTGDVAKVTPQGAPATGAPAKGAQPAATAAPDLAKLASDLTAALGTVEALTKRVAELEAAPAPAKGVVNAVGRVVAKADDGAAAGDAAGAPAAPAAVTPNPADPLAVMKAVHGAGGTLIKI